MNGSGGFSRNFHRLFTVPTCIYNYIDFSFRIKDGTKNWSISGEHNYSAFQTEILAKRASTIGGIWKALNDEWNSVIPEMCLKVFDAWKR